MLLTETVSLQSALFLKHFVDLFDIEFTANCDCNSLANNDFYAKRLSFVEFPLLRS